MGHFSRDYAFCSDFRQADYIPEHQRATIQGIAREDGRAATRNFIGTLSSVNCSATAAKLVAEKTRYSRVLKEFTNADGVVALIYHYGCGMAREGEGMDMLRHTIAGYARHPNFARVLILGLGCEDNQISQIMATEKLTASNSLHTVTIQDTGGRPGR